MFLPICLKEYTNLYGLLFYYLRIFSVFFLFLAHLCWNSPVLVFTYLQTFKVFELQLREHGFVIIFFIKI